MSHTSRAIVCSLCAAPQQPYYGFPKEHIEVNNGYVVDLRFDPTPPIVDFRFTIAARTDDVVSLRIIDVRTVLLHCVSCLHRCARSTFTVFATCAHVCMTVRVSACVRVSVCVRACMCVCYCVSVFA
jgi:hypothetical protein